MRVAAVQLTSGSDIDDNLVLADEAIRRAAEQGARLIVLPEATSQAFATGRLDSQAEGLDGKFATTLRLLAAELEVVIIAGMFRPADSVEREGRTLNRVYNTALITGAGLHTAYDKINTYDAFDYRESDTVRPGTEPVIVEVDGVKIGLAICYDVRFPELFRQLARDGAEIIAVPTSWADGTDKREQWRTLSAARAMDSTAAVVAAGQSRPGGERAAGQAEGPTGIGHSAIISATGLRLAEAGYEPEIIIADIDPEDIARSRETLPIL